MFYIYQDKIAEERTFSESRERNIKLLKEAKPFDEQCLLALDANVNKVRPFLFQLKFTPSKILDLLPNLEKLNLSKYFVEIAAQICDATSIIYDHAPLVMFSVEITARYKEFPVYLLAEFRKRMPSKVGDKVENPSKLSNELSFFTELYLNGIFEKVKEHEGIRFLGDVLGFLIDTDKTEYLNTSVWTPFCRTYFFSLTGILPFSVQNYIGQIDEEEQHDNLVSTLLTQYQRNIIAEKIEGYWRSIAEHTNKQFTRMNKLRKSIRRQERARGKAFVDDYKRLEKTKQDFERLNSCVIELSECIGRSTIELPQEEISEDEQDDHRLSVASVGRMFQNRTRWLTFENLFTFMTASVNVHVFFIAIFAIVFTIWTTLLPKIEKLADDNSALDKKLDTWITTFNISQNDIKIILKSYEDNNQIRFKSLNDSNQIMFKSLQMQIGGLERNVDFLQKSMTMFLDFLKISNHTKN